MYTQATLRAGRSAAMILQTRLRHDVIVGLSEAQIFYGSGDKAAAHGPGLFSSFLYIGGIVLYPASFHADSIARRKRCRPSAMSFSGMTLKLTRAYGVLHPPA